ncbi:MAG: Na/Pi cotransporter family protein [Oscillospiraceae bacterium]|nr:Na/Pi cotransporter family protein [Oscillospiraceae bacterium]
MSGFDIVNIVIKAVGGIALFLYGMSVLGGRLEKLSSGKMEKILEKLTNNVFKSVLLGALVTAAIQSSAATTVIVVGLVNAGILRLSSGIGVIMGANIGTTITGQILRLGDLESNESVGAFLKLLSPSVLAPFIAAVGILIFMLSKKEGGKTIGEIFLGIGILFTGMLSLTDAVSPLSELDAFKNLFATLTNPFLGVVVGAVVTALLQSSSASVGILQAISTTGVLTFSSAFPIIMGQNIGTCVTPIISAVGAGKNAKRAAAVHLYFNIIGTLVFLIIVYLVQYTVGLPFWNESIDMGGIANFHTFFNVVVTLCLMPFTKVLEKLAMLTIRDEPRDKNESAASSDFIAPALEDRLLISPSLAIQQASLTAITMGKIALYNFGQMRKLFEEYDPDIFEKLNENEESIDRMEDRLNAYLVKINECELTDYENRRVTELLHLTSEFERIGDYTMNLIEDAQKLDNEKIRFSDHARKELGVISDAVEEIIGMAIKSTEFNDINTAAKIEPLEETIDYLNETLKARHIERLKNGQCVVESGVNFLDLLINLERISDHCSNIAVYVIGSQRSNTPINRHEFIQNAHAAKDKDYVRYEEEYMAKYAI